MQPNPHLEMGSLGCVSCSRLFPPSAWTPVPLSLNTPFPLARQSFSATRVARQQIEVAENDVLRQFLQERELNGDFISKACDSFWYKNGRNLLADDLSRLEDSGNPEEQVRELQNDDGFLKVSQMRGWVANDMPAPMNKVLKSKALLDDREMRKKLNLLKYEALKKELILLSVGIGAGCTAYCWAVFSVQAAASYAVGVSFSCLYLQLLYQHVDKLSKEMIPQIFLQKRAKKIGIRSQDLQDALEKWVKGCSIALASPRLMIPAAIFGTWVLYHRFWTNDFLDFQIVPAMMGMFVYKAAALVQVYRDNEDLQIILPEDEF